MRKYKSGKRYPQRGSITPTDQSAALGRRCPQPPSPSTGKLRGSRRPETGVRPDSGGSPSEPQTALLEVGETEPGGGGGWQRGDTALPHRGSPARPWGEEAGGVHPWERRQRGTGGWEGRDWGGESPPAERARTGGEGPPVGARSERSSGGGGVLSLTR